MTDPVSPYLNQPVEGKKKNSTVVVVIVIVIIAVLIGSFFIFRQSGKTEQTKVAVTETIKPSPTEKPKIDKKSVKIQVLNGTGTPGQAGDAVEALEDAEYDSDNIKTANAEEFDNSVTTIAVKDGFEDVANDVKDALKTIFDKIEIDSTRLDEDGEFDVVVTTGGKKFVEATPTASAITPTDSEADPTESPTATPTSTLTPTPTP